MITAFARRRHRYPKTTEYAVFALVCIVLLGFLAFTTKSYRPSLFQERKPVSETDKALLKKQVQITDAFQHVWNGYSRYCMGNDTLLPVSNTCDDDFGGWGVTAIDSLTTAIIMGKVKIVKQILRYVATIDFSKPNQGNSIQHFEVVIRHFAGMISAWDLLRGPFSGMIKDEELMASLYAQMVRLGDVLSCAFDTASGVPHDWVNPTTCSTKAGVRTSVAGAGTLILEFNRLSDITGNQTYVELAKTAESHLIAPDSSAHEPYPGLLGSWVTYDLGNLTDARGSWGAMSDSFYEYLLKAYVYDHDAYSHYLDRWKLAVDSTMLYIASHPFGHPEYTFLPLWDGPDLVLAQESLTWFAGGSFILGGMVLKNNTMIDFGLSIADTSIAVYNMTATGLGGEWVHWTPDCDDSWGEDPCTAENSMRIDDTSFKLRPEALETWYYAYRATGNQKYREAAWAFFESINKICKTKSGYAAISNVTAPDGGEKVDKQESFIMAEVLKYMYLIHLEDNAEYQVQDARNGNKNMWVFNTEAHPLKVAGRPVKRVASVDHRS